MKDDILSLVLFKSMLIIMSDDFKDINKGLRPIILFMIFFSILPSRWTNNHPQE
jgi:hypothetical protein